MTESSSDHAAPEELRRVAHELNNLVAVLLGQSEALARTLDAGDPRRKHMDALFDTLRRSEQSVRSLTAIISGTDPKLLQLSPRSANASPEALWGTETVLLVDDEAALRSVTARFLGMNGYKVVEAGGADEALAAFDRAGGSVDVLVTDAMMGAVSGFDLAKSLRGRNASLKILFISGHSPDELRRTAGLGEDLAVLSKPFRPKELLHRLREMLDNGRETASSG